MLRHIENEKKIVLKRILMGECGNETKVIGAIGDKLNIEGIKVEFALTLMEDLPEPYLNFEEMMFM